MRKLNLDDFDPFLGPGNILRLSQRTLVVLCGPSGCGKSNFASSNFPETYIISTDNIRALISDNPRNLSINQETFGLAHHLTRLRLKSGRPTIFDSTAVKAFSRRTLLAIAREFAYKTLLLIFDTPEELCRTRDARRTYPPPVGGQVIAVQYQDFLQTFKDCPDEGFNSIIILKPGQYEDLKVIIEEEPRENNEKGTGLLQ